MTTTDSTACDLFKQIAVVGVNLFFMNLACDQQYFDKKKVPFSLHFYWTLIHLTSYTLYLNGKLSYLLNIFDKR